MKEIKDHPGYFLDKDGNCYSAWNIVAPGKYEIGNTMKKLNGSRTKQGYILIGLGRKKRKYLHHLMLETFVGPRQKGMVACHKNDVPNDNRIENLYWGTTIDNSSDRYANGKGNEGSKHKKSKFTPDQVEYIRGMKGQKKLRELANEFNAAESTISLIQNRKTYCS